ncbi:hypothetical protein DMUE_0814 [Dictyocoela muelleri]|nr:hypothetical protein DMUE_0814 [Dictyocoela muelleri]
MKRLNRMVDHEFFNYIGSNDNIIELMQNLGSVPNKKRCTTCKKYMKIVKTNKYNVGHGWYCTPCKKYINVVSDCDLKNTKISPFVFFKFDYYFYSKIHFTAENIKNNCQIGEKMYKCLL